MTFDEVEKTPTYANMRMLGFSGYNSSHANLPAQDFYREVHVNMHSQYREPPPYPGHSKQTVPSLPGMRQSFSGSETSTDLSVSSQENLATSQRQEPQGEETQTQQSYHHYDLGNFDSGYSILARLGMPTTGMDYKPHSAPSIFVPGTTTIHGPHYASSPNAGYRIGTTPSVSFQSPGGKTHSNESLHSQTDGRHVPISEYEPVSNVSVYNNSTLYANYPRSEYGGMEYTQSGPLASSYFTHLPPPPQYGAQHYHELLDRCEIKRSYETVEKTDLTGSRSQPELSQFSQSHSKPVKLFYSGSDDGSQQSIEQSGSQMENHMVDLDQIAAQATRMVEMLSEENKGLREKLNAYDKKVSKLQKFEMEIQKVHEAYESLVRSSQKREMLEALMKKKLEEELKKLQQQNTELKEQIESFGISLDGISKTPTRNTDGMSELQKKDASINSLFLKNKELQVIKEKQDLELESRQMAVQEQKAQIDILDNALANAQSNVVRLEEELRRRHMCSENAEKIQQELAVLRSAYNRKEQLEKQFRLKLEREIETLRSQQKTSSLGRKTDSSSDIMSMKRQLDEKEAKILQLEKEIIQWKEQQLEESIRKLKMQEDYSSCESRLPVYDLSPMDTERLINEAKADKLKQMEEVYQANCKVAELEAKVKTLQTQLSEKEAMLRIVQRSPMTRSSSVHTLYSSPLHSPRPSLIAGTSGTLSQQNSSQLDSGTQREFRHTKTGSTSALETGRKLSLEEELLDKIQSLQTGHKSDSDDSTDKVWQV
ncbi:hypothetical protein CHS0354_035039 [Potamilus streckersoni]|uniref:Angiomotin C-terminal domain-containing protein n=1 Tax=Potamilus streckersoni TaxID=2493646 RepID=A0AAE0VTY2_9BIVA|nr:hypothetical protein CHS0354_035039 [Potamilus streckersoni]